MATGRHKGQWLAERPYILALLIVLALIVWMLSGAVGKKSDQQVSSRPAIILPTVQVQTFHAKNVENTAALYGRTEPDRQVIIQAQVSGEVIQTYAARGSFVKKGDVIAKIALNDLLAKQEHYRTLLKQRRVEYYGAKALFKDGYQNEAVLAQRLADVTEIKAELAKVELDIENTTIVAPFDGVLNERYVEVGDYVAVGENLAMIADLNPLVIRAHISENQIAFISEGQVAEVSLLNKQRLSGKVRYIASVADDRTNTFKTEIAVVNDDQHHLAGISAEVNIPMATVSAIKVSPALLALDEQGNLGIKSVIDNTVVFDKVQIVKSDDDGIWLSGLGRQPRIITLGQGFVRAGDQVEAVEVTN
ncbi:efflux RND transporter periplasmic adaptor subunit [Thalassotalea maritima]|uniref:efflux RND transporter periplasmic adaptor subunit n=1 Tax=Thalassotalea maritima TaxID=3242416 RepID=UPI003526C98A